MRILVAEDSAVYRHLITGHLKEWGFDVVFAKDGAEAWNLLQQPTLVLLDWVLPEIDGIELCRRIRRAAVPGGYTYTVLISGKDGKNDLLEGMQAGADDYLVKPFEPLELKARLLVGERILNLRRELVEARDSLRMAATYDLLTRLLNRGAVVALLDGKAHRHRGLGCPRSISAMAIFRHLRRLPKQEATRITSGLRTIHPESCNEETSSVRTRLSFVNRKAQRWAQRESAASLARPPGCLDRRVRLKAVFTKPT